MTTNGTETKQSLVKKHKMNCKNCGRKNKYSKPYSYGYCYVGECKKIKKKAYLKVYLQNLHAKEHIREYNREYKRKRRTNKNFREHEKMLAERRKDLTKNNEVVKLIEAEL